MKTFLLYCFLMMHYPEKRQVLIFYNTSGTAQKDRQVAVLQKEDAAMQERDMSIETYLLTNAKAKAKKWHINTASPFMVILVGKDGGEKLRSDSVVSTNTFFKTIDAMPMRKEEM